MIGLLDTCCASTWHLKEQTVLIYNLASPTGEHVVKLYEDRLSLHKVWTARPEMSLLEDNNSRLFAVYSLTQKQMFRLLIKCVYDG